MQQLVGFKYYVLILNLGICILLRVLDQVQEFHPYYRVPIRPVFPGTVPFFIQMSRVNFKSPAFSKYPSVFSIINVISTDEKKET
jgi:hypothetical protein